ncbi:MAG: hypothetical protein A3J72_03955 [Nitrospirae bacterium RIFCSPHIGHO2_02_FULL_40_19]|nr:MAG: hypothetical protein A3J72_03955 [Nitrospirae bacterium RIFCSPHIGHO2_02_FULL_40_19]
MFLATVISSKYLDIFFVGAAIENSMADEIWEQLKKGTLSNASIDSRTNNAPFFVIPECLNRESSI